MKRMINQPGHKEDGNFLTQEEGYAVIQAIAHERKWPANILALELDSWKARF